MKIGDRFGSPVAVRTVGGFGACKPRMQWRFARDCGGEIILSASEARHGYRTHCGCGAPKTRVVWSFPRFSFDGETTSPVWLAFAQLIAPTFPRVPQVILGVSHRSLVSIKPLMCSGAVLRRTESRDGNMNSEGSLTLGRGCNDESEEVESLLLHMKSRDYWRPSCGTVATRTSSFSSSHPCQSSSSR
jgi:hypothetical protein